MQSLIKIIDSECVNHITRFDDLELFCAGGTRKKTGETIALHQRNILSRVQQLEQSSTSSSSFPRLSLGSAILPPSSTIVDSKLSFLSAELSLIKSIVSSLTSQVG